MWPIPQFPADLVTFTEEICNKNFIFCTVSWDHGALNSNIIYLFLITQLIEYTHCVKSVQIWVFFCSAFSRIRTEYGEILSLSVFSPNAGKYGPEKTPYLDTFHAVLLKQTSNSSSYIFRAASIIMKWEQLLEVATFPRHVLFRKYLTVWCSYFFLITASW